MVGDGVLIVLYIIERYIVSTRRHDLHGEVGRLAREEVLTGLVITPLVLMLVVIIGTDLLHSCIPSDIGGNHSYIEAVFVLDLCTRVIEQRVGVDVHRVHIHHIAILVERTRNAERFAELVLVDSRVADGVIYLTEDVGMGCEEVEYVVLERRLATDEMERTIGGGHHAVLNQSNTVEDSLGLVIPAYLGIEHAQFLFCARTLVVETRQVVLHELLSDCVLQLKGFSKGLLLCICICHFLRFSFQLISLVKLVKDSFGLVGAIDGCKESKSLRLVEEVGIRLARLGVSFLAIDLHTTKNHG